MDFFTKLFLSKIIKSFILHKFYFETFGLLKKKKQIIEKRSKTFTDRMIKQQPIRVLK